MKATYLIPFLLITYSHILTAQNKEKSQNDFNTPLHQLQPNYKVPYRVISPEEVKTVMDKVYGYLERVTPPEIVDAKTGEVLKDLKQLVPDAILKQGDFRLTSYEWGVTYSAMLIAGKNTGDKSYTNYATTRLNFLNAAAKYFKPFNSKFPEVRHPMERVLEPRALDDAGAICASMIKSELFGVTSELRPLIDNYMQYIMTKEYRLKDGTFARRGPLPNTLWLDDLYMSVPAIAQMGKLTGDKKYYDEAVKQILQFSERMFNKEKGLYMHGWVESMDVHPEFHWARANGWALMTKVEVLEVLPNDHPGRPAVMQLLKDHIRGLANYQSGDGFWHQLIDRNDSYLETSSTAMYTFCIAHAINRGWISRPAHAPMALLAWNALTTKVNDKGQVEGTCVGTGMAFDPAFYYYRPVNAYAAHGYGPVLLAGSAIYELVKDHVHNKDDSALIFSN